MAFLSWLTTLSCHCTTLMSDQVNKMRTGLRLTSSFAGRFVVPCRLLSSTVKKHQLTSKAIGTTADGDYNWSAFALLQYHEMLRRELGRGTTALNNFKLAAKPWQAFCFAEWFEHFMIPVMNEHHTVEDVVFRPAYKSVHPGAPENFKDDHTGLAKLIEEVNKTAKRLDEFAKIPTSEALSSMYEAESSLKAQYNKLVEFSHAHMSEEEQYFLPILDKHGENFYYKIQNKVGDYTLRNYEKIYPLTTCAVIACMGITVRDSKVKEEVDKGWAGKALRERVLTRMFPDIRDGILPEWNKFYTMHRLMIDGIVDEENVAEIHLKIEQLTASMQPKKK